MMKRFYILLLALFLLVPSHVEAKTLNQLKTELDQKEEEYEANQKRLAELKKEISDLNTEISNTNADIEATTEDIGLTEEEIETKKIEINQKELDIDYKENQINKKDDEIRDMLQFYQLTSGDMAYLEFVFGSKDFSDFLRRINIVTRISKHNTDLIEEINVLVQELQVEVEDLGLKINELEIFKKDLEEKEEKLRLAKIKMNDFLTILYEEKDTENDLKLELNKEIELMRDTIKLYEQMGCNPNVDVSQCVSTIPPDVAFLRPLVRGYVTSEFGYRISPVGGGSFHSGIDLGGVSVGTDVYAAAAGTVIATYYDRYGGNQVVVHHYVNGKKYSTLYAHLSKIYVSKGQAVTRDSVIGALGNTGSSTGPHLHFTILNGYFLLNYGWSSYYTMIVNPRNFVNFPGSRYSYFDNRLIKYN